MFKYMAKLNCCPDDPLCNTSVAVQASGCSQNVDSYVYSYVYNYVDSYVYNYVDSYVYNYVYSYVYSYVYDYVCSYVYNHVYKCVQSIVESCLRASRPALFILMIHCSCWLFWRFAGK